MLPVPVLIRCCRLTRTGGTQFSFPAPRGRNDKSSGANGRRYPGRSTSMGSELRVLAAKMAGRASGASNAAWGLRLFDLQSDTRLLIMVSVANDLIL